MIFKKIILKDEVQRYQDKLTSFLQEYVAYGIFFRSPIQVRNYDVMPYDWNEMCAAGYLKQNRFNPIARLLNFKRWKGWLTFVDEDNAAGIGVRVLVSPIYFQRVYRESTHHLNDTLITLIKSKGYEPYRNYCSGACEVEKTVTYFRDGTKDRKVTIRDSFHYTYHHVVVDAFCKDYNHG